MTQTQNKPSGYFPESFYFFTQIILNMSDFYSFLQQNK